MGKKAKFAAKAGEREVTLEKRSRKELSWWAGNAIQFSLYVALIVTIFTTRQQIQYLSASIEERQEKTKARQKQRQANEREIALIQKVRECPQDSQSYQELARYYKNMGRGKEAIAHYRHALEISPESEELHLEFGRLLLNFPEHQEEALEHLQKVLALDPGHRDRTAIEAWIQSILSNKKG